MKEKSKNYCLYRMYDNCDYLLYVGISISVMSRLESHWSSKEWIGEVSKITIERFSNQEELANAERLAIKSESPIHNIALNKFNERPSVKIRKNKQKRAFSQALSEYVDKTQKSWFSCAYELGVCHTAVSRWKNAKICPNRRMLEKIQKWSNGELLADDFDFSKF